MTRRVLKPGSQAPQFQHNDLEGIARSLADYQGKRLMLSFFRYGGCPLCNLRMAQLHEAFPRFSAQGLEILAVFESPAERLRETAAPTQTAFPILPDPDRELYRLYGVQASWLGYLIGAFRLRSFHQAFHRGFKIRKGEGAIAQLPAEFLVGPDLKIARAYYGRDIGDHLPFPEIDAWLRTDLSAHQFDGVWQ